MAGLEDTSNFISDDTMAGLPSVIHSEEDDNSINNTGHDMFETTMIPTFTSTQLATPSDEEVNILQQHDTFTQLPTKAQVCIDGCKHRSGKAKGIGPVQCHLCQHWLHPPCVGERDKDIVNLWTCPTCRNVPDMIIAMSTMMKSIQKENRQLRKLVSDSFSNINEKLDQQSRQGSQKDANTQLVVSSLNTRTQELTASAKEVADLRVKVTELTNQLTAHSWREFRSQNKSVLVGSSMIKDISSSRLHNTDVVCVPGGKINDIKDKVMKLSSDVTHDKAVLVVGGNDCDPLDPSDIKTPAAIIDDYRSLVTVAKTKAQEVIVSSVVPRMKSIDIQNRIDDVNAGLQVMCGEERVSFIDNRKSFHLGDGSINDGYYQRDGVHLTGKATNKLAKNLQLKLRDGFHSVCNTPRPGKAPQSDSDPSVIDANDDGDRVSDKDHTFWSYAKRKAGNHSHSQKSQRTSRANHRDRDDSKSPDSRHNNDTRCFNCHETNHTIKTCRHERPVVCHTCGTEGHKAKHHTQ